MADTTNVTIPDAAEYECPYNGRLYLDTVTGLSSVTVTRIQYARCGERGWLCHRCREDRADARMQRIGVQVEASAAAMIGELAALLEFINSQT